MNILISIAALVGMLWCIFKAITDDDGRWAWVAGAVICFIFDIAHRGIY